ncbi:fimbria/pilus periplasmic chaperone [Burkholderia sp. JSH-S8]|nr:fimbria/pilus periplasmic chaperone [Burkholderia sp. JSH-S8]
MTCAAQAAVVITGTRVIYPAENREVNVRLRNVDARPVLVQTWLDDGDAAAAPNQIKVPFVLLPAVFRLDPKKGQSLRIMYAGGDMPKDRESVYWLNVLEIPPKPEDAESRNMIQLAFRTRIKMFYRPASLQDDPASVRGQLQWALAFDDKGQRVLRVENPSPYYVSIGSVSLEAGGRKIPMQPNMAPPFGGVDFVPESGRIDAAGTGVVSFAVLNDFGTEVSDAAPVAGAAK